MSTISAGRSVSAPGRGACACRCAGSIVAGPCLVEQGKNDEALAEARCSIELEPGATDHRNDAGVVHRTVGDFDAACDHFRAALVLDQGNAKAALNLAKTKRFTTRDDEDAHLIRAAAQHPASSPSAQRDLDLALGKIHGRSRRVGGRVRALRKGEPPVRDNRTQAGRRVSRVDGPHALRLRWGVVRDASLRDESRSDSGVHRRHAAFGHHAGRAASRCPSGGARGGRAERHTPARSRSRFARRHGRGPAAHRGRSDQHNARFQRRFGVPGMRACARCREDCGSGGPVSRSPAYPLLRGGADFGQASGQLPAPGFIATILQAPRSSTVDETPWTTRSRSTSPTSWPSTSTPTTCEPSGA